MALRKPGGFDDGAVLGISCDYHDAAACVVVDGRVVAAAEEERFSRVKHDPDLPRRAIASCLAVAGVAAADISVIAFYEKPLDVIDRYLRSRQRRGPRGLPSFVRDMPRLIDRNLMVGYRLQSALRSLGAVGDVPVRYVPHHLSHAAAAFLPSPFAHAAVLTVDGIGEWATASVATGSHHRIETVEELRYPDSLGLVYSFVTSYCGFTPNSDEYKVMGLAPYGEPRFLDQLRALVSTSPDGSVHVDARGLDWYSGRTGRRIADAFDGPPRLPSDPLTGREADLAASVQRLTEESLLGMARHAHELTGEADLCMAGGVALNCVANGRLLREAPFERIWIQPASGDAGSAVGAALATWYEHNGHQRSPLRPDGMSGAFLGPRALPEEVDRWVADERLTTTRFPDFDELADEVAERIIHGAVVGWFQERMEFGPRALGHRSILADPRSDTVRQRLNAMVKGREQFRPFAPAVLEEHAAEWFELDVPSPYMLLVARLRREHLLEIDREPGSLDERGAVARSTVPACTHVDGTARIQTVTASTNPRLHRLISAFHRRTGCPMLVNTSFNVAGEPIVATPDDALRTARRGGLDLLVVEHHLIDGRDMTTDPTEAASRC